MEKGVITVASQPQLKNHIQQHREQRGLNQDQLATQLGLTRTYLSKLENQKFPPSPGLMTRVCQFFGKELGEMFYIDKGGKFPG